MNTSEGSSVPFGLQQFACPFHIIKQTSPTQERVSFNGLQKTVHVVVKNAPFTIQLGLTSNIFMGQVLDLNNFTYDCVLLYDTDVCEKGVDYVKVKPVEFKATVNEAGDQVSLECRIKVLTSHHENNFFRVKIILLDPTSGQSYHPALITYSEPVRVISKPEQLKKKQPANKKRTANDILVETITRIEQQQAEQQRLIERLLAKKAEKAAAAQVVAPAPEIPKLPERKECEPGSEFEMAFRQFFEVYNCLPQEEKPVKIRKLVRNSAARDTERISEFLDLFMTEGLQRGLKNDLFSSGSSLSGCKCTSCPYQKELERIDEFYKDFLSVTPLDQSTASTEEKLFFA